MEGIVLSDYLLLMIGLINESNNGDLWYVDFVNVMKELI